MLSQVTKWLQSQARKPATRLVATRPRLRGHFEQLEVRTVLSASFGMQSANFESGGAAAGERSFAPTSWRSDYVSASATAAAPWEDSPGLGRSISRNTSGGLGAPLQLKAQSVTTDLLNGRVIDRGFVVTIYLPGSGPAIYQGPQLRLDWGSVLSSGSKPIAATSPYPALQNDPRPDPPGVYQVPIVPAESFTRLLEKREISSAVAFRGQGTAVPSESTDSLLLATTLRDLQVAGSDRAGDDPWTQTGQDEGFADLCASVLDGNEVSLEVLENEREALDAVFSRLSDLEVRQVKFDEDAGQQHQPWKTETQHHDLRDQIKPPDATSMVATRHDIAEGGMVLLEPTGGSNLSAFDLIEVIAGTNQNAIDLPLGVEAAIGMYQAFDVGVAAEPRPNVSEAAPIPAPAAAGHSNTSADVAPSKQAEQPS
jgi:hypothetical protein